jgi:hypothetical protein
LLFTAATDLGDGLVARHFGQTSRLGKILDPLAAKLFLACLLGALAYTAITNRFARWPDRPCRRHGADFQRQLRAARAGAFSTNRAANIPLK